MWLQDFQTLTTVKLTYLSIKTPIHVNPFYPFPFIHLKDLQTQNSETCKLNMKKSIPMHNISWHLTLSWFDLKTTFYFNLNFASWWVQWNGFDRYSWHTETRIDIYNAWLVLIFQEYTGLVIKEKWISETWPSVFLYLNKKNE